MSVLKRIKGRKGLIVKVLLLLIFLGALGWGGYTYYLANIKVYPDQVLQKALQHAGTAQSYRYQVDVQVKVNNQERKLSRISGEKAGGDLYFHGLIHNQEVKVYQIGDGTYLWDPITGKWAVTPSNRPFDQPHFLIEANPLACFNFVSVDGITYLGKEEVAGRKAYVIQCAPAIKHDFMNAWFKDFSYKVWIDAKNKAILKAQVSGFFRDQPENTVFIKLEFKDYGADIKIPPPG
ncbi:MAG: hypothetical protein ACOY9Y_11290 [Bacillota bacterium]